MTVANSHNVLLVEDDEGIAALESAALEAHGFQVKQATFGQRAVTGDRARLLEAVRHLLDNAVQYLGDQAAPRIEVGVRAAATPDTEPGAMRKSLGA